MPKNPNLSPHAAELRRGAEERLRQQHSDWNPAQTEADAQGLVHELQVHQIELEMQKRYGFKGALPKPFDNHSLQKVLVRVTGSATRES